MCALSHSMWRCVVTEGSRPLKMFYDLKRTNNISLFLLDGPVSRNKINSSMTAVPFNPACIASYLPSWPRMTSPRQFRLTHCANYSAQFNPTSRHSHCQFYTETSQRIQKSMRVIATSRSLHGATPPPAARHAHGRMPMISARFATSCRALANLPMHDTIPAQLDIIEIIIH
jgi:hypothetical protein